MIFFRLYNKSLSSIEHHSIKTYSEYVTLVNARLFTLTRKGNDFSSLQHVVFDAPEKLLRRTNYLNMFCFSLNYFSPCREYYSRITSQKRCKCNVLNQAKIFLIIEVKSGEDMS